MCGGAKKILVPPYYSRRAIFASPLSTVIIFDVVLLPALLQHYLSAGKKGIQPVRTSQCWFVGSTVEPLNLVALSNAG